MNDQIEIELPSGRIALVDVMLEPAIEHFTDHWVSGGVIRSRDYVETGWRVCDISGMNLLLPDSRERVIRIGSKLWNTVVRHLSKKIELAL